MNMSQKSEQLLAEWEGCALHVYLDVAGLKTIGVGHLLTKDELSSGKIIILTSPVKYAGGLTEEQVLELLGQDLRRFNHAVSDGVIVALQQHQFDALVSFAFNVGVGAFKRSTLLRVLNEVRTRSGYDLIPAQLRRWVYSGGNKVRGLVNRRENEVKLWNGEFEACLAETKKPPTRADRP